MIFRKLPNWLQWNLELISFHLSFNKENVWRNFTSITYKTNNAPNSNYTLCRFKRPQDRRELENLYNNGVYKLSINN